MVRSLFLIGLLGWMCNACGSSSDPSSAVANAGSSGTTGGESCPDVSGSWDISAHCDASVIGMTLQVTEANCALSFAAPFDQFRGSVATDGKITLSGPQSCTGTATASSVSMDCTPAPCPVKLSR